MNNMFSLAVNNIKERKLRSWLTVIGIVIGIGAIVTLIFLGNGLENAINMQFSKMGVSNIRITPGNLRGPPSGEIGFSDDIIDKVESVKSVEYVNPILLNLADVEYGNEILYLYSVGYDTKLSKKGFIDTDVDVTEGRLFEESDKDVAIVGYNVAYDKFKKDISVKNNIKINGRNVKIIGIFEDTGTELDDRIYIPLDTARSIFNKYGFVNVLAVKIREGLDMEKAGEDIKNKLKKTMDEKEFSVYTPKQLLDQLSSILGAIKIILSGIAAISLVVGGIGIMNSMFTSVLERTRQIGIMKAIGATKKDILSLFLIESGLIGLGGGLIGVVLGITTAKIVEVVAFNLGFSLLVIKLDFLLIGLVLFFAFFIGMVSGAIPAYQAASLKPVDALRYE